jgi:hypothetical protein
VADANVPTEPGWWLRRVSSGEWAHDRPVYVHADAGVLTHHYGDTPGPSPVDDDGRWRGRLRTQAEVAAVEDAWEVALPLVIDAATAAARREVSEELTAYARWREYAARMEADDGRMDSRVEASVATLRSIASKLAHGEPLVPKDGAE